MKKRITKAQAIEALERIERWDYTYNDDVQGDARFRARVAIILEEIAKPVNAVVHNK